MYKRLVFVMAIFTATTAVAVEYNRYPKRVDNYPGSNNSWPICKGKRELMPYCVIDGDSLRVDYEDYRIGNLDTPETRQPKCEEERQLGFQAKELTHKLLNGAQTVRFTLYINPLGKRPVRDKYGRVLVDVSADDVDVAGELKKNGLARDYAGDTKSSWCPNGL